MRFRPYHALLAAALALPLVAGAKKKDDETVDYVELASVLVQDGHYDRAEAALLEADLDDEAVDLGRYHAVYGLIRLNRGELSAARSSFYAAIDSGLTDEVTDRTPAVIYIYLAQIHYGLEEYRRAIESLDKAGESASRLSSTWVMRAHAHWLLGEIERSWMTLDLASARFPGNHGFLRRKIFYLIELGLFQEAASIGREYLALTEGTVEDYVAIGNALRRAREYSAALKFLETARLTYPDNEDVAKVLALTYVEMDRPLTAADIFFQASLTNPELVSEAAELYRRAGHVYRSLSLNAEIVDPAKKLKQRLAIFLELERFDQITAMEDALIRAGLLAEEDLRYALAFAHFQVGDYVASERHLTQLTRPDLFRKAVELRRAIEDCVKEPWRCS